MQNIIPIAEFKTHCYKLLDQSQKDCKSFVITRKGKPIATMIPLHEDKKKTSLFGMMKNIASINGDIMETIDIEWDAQNE